MTNTRNKVMKALFGAKEKENYTYHPVSKGDSSKACGDDDSNPSHSEATPEGLEYVEYSLYKPVKEQRLGYTPFVFKGKVKELVTRIPDEGKKEKLGAAVTYAKKN